jgi:cytochrome c5
MGAAVAADGSATMQCQSCHGTMSQVGAASRTGWLDEPNCQQCHTGSATQNNGQLRYTSVFDTNGAPRVPVSQMFATNPNTPLADKSLYRFSKGHGGLQCSACHGSTHAEFPATHRNDNLQNITAQGHAGTRSNCISCHPSMPSTVSGGPHGMHPTGTNWPERFMPRLPRCRPPRHPALALVFRPDARLQP